MGRHQLFVPLSKVASALNATSEVAIPQSVVAGLELWLRDDLDVDRRS